MTVSALSYSHPAPAISKKIRCFKWRKNAQEEDRKERDEQETYAVESRDGGDKYRAKKIIKEGQTGVREAIEEECEQLREESKLMVQLSTQTQLRLVLMFQILKAREELTQLLREILARTTSSIE